MMEVKRWVVGQGFTGDRRAGGPQQPPSPTGKLDPEVSLVSSDDESEIVRFKIEAYDPATHNIVAELRIYIIPAGVELAGDEKSLRASDYPFAAVDVSQDYGGVTVEIPYPEGSSRPYMGRTLIGFAS